LFRTIKPDPATPVQELIPLQERTMSVPTSLIRILVLVCWLSAAVGLQRLDAQEKVPGVPGSQSSTIPGYTIQLDTITSGFDGQTCWVAPRAGIVPGKSSGSNPSVVLTMQKLWLKGSDVFFAVHEVRTDDLGKTWSPPLEHATLDRRKEPNGVEIMILSETIRGTGFGRSRESLELRGPPRRHNPGLLSSSGTRRASRPSDRSGAVRIDWPGPARPGPGPGRYC